MEKITITEIKAAAKKANCEVIRSGYLNNCPAYKVITGDRERLMTEANVFDLFARGDLF